MFSGVVRFAGIAGRARERRHERRHVGHRFTGCPLEPPATDLGTSRERSVAGGDSNVASGAGAAVGGGIGDHADGNDASVSGGLGRWTPASANWAAGSLLQSN